MALPRSTRRTLLGPLALALAATGLPAAGAAAAPADPAPLVGRAAAGEASYLVVLRPGAEVGRAAARAGTVERRFSRVVQGYAATLSAAELAEVRADPAVAYVERDRAVQRQAPVPQEPGLDGSGWNLDRIDQRSTTRDGQYSPNRTGAGVTAYMIGWQLSPDPEFGNRLKPGWAWNGGDGVDARCSVNYDGIVLGGRRWGVAKGVTLRPVAVATCAPGGVTTGGTLADVVAGLEWIAADHVAGRPAVAHFGQWPWPDRMPTLDAAVRGLVSAGVTTVVPANDYGALWNPDFDTNACNHSPGGVPEAITVGASTPDDARLDGTAWGPCLDLFAPGTEAWASSKNGGFEAWSGARAAAPHASGVAAMYLQGRPSATPAQVRSALVNSASRNKIRNAGTGSLNRLLYAFPSDTPPATTAKTSLPSGTALRKGESVSSPNGYYRLVTQADGNVVLYTGGGRALWVAGRRAASWLTLQGDGNLVAYDYGKPLWSSGSRSTTPTELRVQDDGNLVVYRLSDRKAIWSSGTAGRVPQAQPPAGDRAQPNQALLRGGRILTSASGRYTAAVRGSTGAFVVRDTTTARDIFSTGSTASDWLTVQTDGNVVLYDRTGRAVWSAGSGGRGAGRLVMRDNGVLTLMRVSDGRTLWTSTRGRV